MSLCLVYTPWEITQSIACLRTKLPSKYVSLYVWSMFHFLLFIFRSMFLILFLMILSHFLCLGHVFHFSVQCNVSFFLFYGWVSVLFLLLCHVAQCLFLLCFMLGACCISPFYDRPKVSFFPFLCLRHTFNFWPMSLFLSLNFGPFISPILYSGHVSFFSLFMFVLVIICRQFSCACVCVALGLYYFIYQPAGGTSRCVRQHTVSAPQPEGRGGRRDHVSPC